MASSLVSRKEKRKQERQEKKQRKNKRQRVAEPSHATSKAPQQQQPAKRTPHRPPTNPTRVQNRFHELVQETTGRSMRSTEDELSREDAEIKALESKLGLANKKDGIKRLQKEYSKDGLGDDFTDFLSSLDTISELVDKAKTKKPTSVDVQETKPKKSKAVEHKKTARKNEEEDHDDSEMEDDSEMDDFPSDMEMDEETRREFELLQQEDAEFLKGMDELPTDESDLDSDEDLGAFDSEEEEDDDDEDEEVRRNTMKNAQGMDDEEEDDEGEEEEDEEDDDEEEEQEEEASGSEPEEEEEAASEDENVIVTEDIYGRPVVQPKDGPKKPSAYIPPHLRRQLQQQAAASTETSSKSLVLSSTMDEQSLRELTRRVNGQLNRISESNMESITLEMEKIYREYGRSIVNTILLDKLIQTSVHPKQVMTPLVKVCGALVAALFHSVGSEIGGFFVEKVVLQLIERMDQQDHDDDKQEEEEEAGSTSKAPVNLLLLIAVLYNFGVVQCTLIYDLFRRLVDRFTSLDVELIHHLLKSCGHQLRADDQDALKEMVAAVQQQVAQRDQASDERMRFMLDLIYDLKKPKSKKGGSAATTTLNAMSGTALDLTSLKKWLGRVKTRCGNANNALRLSLHELLHAEQDGRWWIVGGTWVGYKQTQQETSKEDDTRQDEEHRLLKLAEKQRMNTDVRKRIFVAIMGATDCLDAYERLMQLHLKEKQEREIVRVILHCCGHEKTFNKYYVVLSNKLCEMDARYKFTYQLAFWDVFKQLESSVTPRRLFNLAQLLAGLVIDGTLSLSVLKVLDFTALETKSILFVRLVLEQIMKLDDAATMASVFERLLQTKKAQLTIDGLAVFCHQHLTSFKTEEDPTTRQLLKQRAKTVKSLLDSLAKSAHVAANAEAFR